MEYGRRDRIARRAGTRRPDAFVLLVLAGTASLGAAVGVGSLLIAGGVAAAARYAEPLGRCAVTDGDTIRCGRERIRLLGIDAPELPDHCRVGRACVAGDPWESTRSLAGAMIGRLTIDRVDTDRYGRTLALVAGDKGDLSCWQLEHGQAVYKARWDDGLRVARACPNSVMRSR